MEAAAADCSDNKPRKHACCSGNDNQAAPATSLLIMVSAPPVGERRRLLDWIPREHVGRTIQRREGRAEGAFELLIELLRRPAVAAVHRTDRTVLVEEKYLIVAH